MKTQGPSYLAEALGISVEELQAAHQSAWEKGLQQLVDTGEITQAQAERLAERGFSPKIGSWLAPDADLDYDALLAAELGISVAELNAAREKAQELNLQAAIESGQITTEQADLIQARQAIMPYLNRETLTANALGISVAELQAAREEGLTLPEVLAAQGLDGIAFQKAMLDAYQAAIQQAVQDGVITQTQAEVFLNQGLIGGLRMPGHTGRHGRMGGFNNFQDPPTMVEPENEL
jgi:polyhydroxyalkanoate synthesis regulator phasin